jgi:hypothetical protein
VKVRGSYKPQQLEYEIINNGRTALMNFYENIKAYTDPATDNMPESKGYEFNRYTIIRPHTLELKERVTANIKNWLSFARQEALAELESQKEDFISETHRLLGEALATPMELNGKRFSVTLEKQNLLSAQLGLFAMAQQAETPFVLEWNESGQECTEWTFEDLFGLSVAMASYVRPLVSAQRQAEVQITEADSIEDIGGIINDYQQHLAQSIS